MIDRPRYAHDCQSCVYLGHDREFDLYVCNSGAHDTVIARRSDEPSDYKSGLPAIGKIPEITEAAIRAVMLGLLDPDVKTGSGDGLTIRQSIGFNERNMRRFIIRVYDEDRTGFYRTYSVPASSEPDARLLAFVLDGGRENNPYVDEGEVELAYMHTRVVETAGMTIGPDDVELLREIDSASEEPKADEL